jgi:PHD/YefM family antitoxin component YafN of YafNO toxin-antitoxin module
MKRLPIAKAHRPLAQYAAELDGEVLVVTDGNRPVAALVPLKDFDRESLRLSTNPEFLRLIEQSRAEIAAGKSLSLNEVRKRVLPRTRASKRPSRPAARRRRG